MTCTKCRMTSRRILFKQDYNIRVDGIKIERHHIQLCGPCISQTFKTLLESLTPAEMHRQLIYLEGKGNKG